VLVLGPARARRQERQRQDHADDAERGGHDEGALETVGQCHRQRRARVERVRYPLQAGGVADAGRIEGPGGDLAQFGLNGELLDLDQARAAVASSGVPA
jgi:hypothetical protein